MTNCFSCQKKLKLVVAIKGKCRCENTYCTEHLRMHHCNFDYKSLQKQKLLQENPKIICDKLTKI